MLVLCCATRIRALTDPEPAAAAPRLRGCHPNMPNDEKAYGNRWRVIERIGSRGQGGVYKVADIMGLPTHRALETTLEAFGTMWSRLEMASEGYELTSQPACRSLFRCNKRLLLA